MKIICGIDPGSLFTGYGIIKYDGRNFTYIAHGVITNSSKDDFYIRIKKIGDELKKVFEQFRPTDVVIEKIFLGKNADSAFKLGHVRGIALYLAQEYEVRVVEYAARVVKKGITGSGAADKEQVRFLIQNYLKLKQKIQIDAADALALSVYHAQRIEIEKKFSRIHKEAII